MKRLLTRCILAAAPRALLRDASRRVITFVRQYFCHATDYISRLLTL